MELYRNEPSETRASKRLGSVEDSPRRHFVLAIESFYGCSSSRQTLLEQLDRLGILDRELRRFWLSMDRDSRNCLVNVEARNWSDLQEI